jgi:hypothetical protein
MARVRNQRHVLLEHMHVGVDQQAFRGVSRRHVKFLLSLRTSIQGVDRII